jgi:hypothetical protein
MGERVFRTDSGSKLARFPRNGAGAVRLPATVARTGIQVRNGVREFRPESEVFAADSLASLASVPVTLNHPDDGVSPQNMRAVTIGHVTDTPPEARVKIDGSSEQWLKTTLIVADGEALDAIDADEASEVSCGYFCEMLPQPGVHDGQPYDVLVTGIKYNHVAILTKNTRARAGAEAKLRLDSKDMKTVIIDGVSYEHGSDAHLAKLQADAASNLARETARADKAEGSLAAEKLRADKAEAQLTADAVDARVEARFNLLKQAAQYLPGNYDTKGKSDAQIRLDAVVATHGSEIVAGKSEAFVDGMFALLSKSGSTAASWQPQGSAQPSAGSAPVRADGTKLTVDNDDDIFRKNLASKPAKDEE